MLLDILSNMTPVAQQVAGPILLPTGQIVLIFDGKTGEIPDEIKDQCLRIVRRALRPVFMRQKWFCFADVHISRNTECLDNALTQCNEMIALAAGGATNELKSQREYGVWRSAITNFTQYTEIRQALDNNKFYFQLQPVVNDRRLPVGAEALLRWKDSNAGPEEFLQNIEKLELMDLIEFHVVDMAKDLLIKWQANTKLSNLKLSINLTPSFVERRLMDMLQSWPMNLLAMMEIEVLERYKLHETIKPATLRALSDMGISIALDDFGTGEANYLSIRYLPKLNSATRMSHCKIKIDQSFVRNDAKKNYEYSETVCETVTFVGRKENVTVAAEGVENNATFEKLKQLGVTAFQGYGISEPLNEDDFVKWYTANHP